MSVIINGFDKPEDCLGCPFLSKLEEISVGSNGLYKKIGHCKFASEIMPDLEDPWHDMEWLYTHTEEWCPITQINVWPEIHVDLKMTEEDLKEFIKEFQVKLKLSSVMSTQDYFKGLCPYTNKECKDWKCSRCPVEEQERKWAEGKEGEEDDPISGDDTTKP